MNKLNWLTNVDEIEPKITEPYAALVRDTSDAAMESLEAMWPLKNGSIKTMKINWKYGYWFITPNEVGKDIIFSSYTCTGGLEEFKTIYALKEKGEKINVTYNVENSPKGPMAVNVSVVK